VRIPQASYPFVKTGPCPAAWRNKNNESGASMANRGTGRLPTRIGGSNKLISLADTAELLGVPTSTLYKRWREFGLPAYRVGRAIKFRERDIDAWLETRRIA
jgi:excisionase family DNA binding protein